MAESGKATRTEGKRRKWPYRVAIAFLIVATLLLIAQDQDTLRVESPVEASDPRFADYVASLVDAAVEPGDAYTVLRNGEAFPPNARGDRAGQVPDHVAWRASNLNRLQVEC